MNKNIVKDELQNQFARKYLAYALSTITQRALPDVRDGLKPVHRRLIYAMYLLHLSPKSQFKKSARVVGDVIGKFHPHGDQSVYDALVRLAQDFSTHYPLVDGQGNFGNIDGDNAAAMRYTETKLTKTAEYLLIDIEEDTVNFKKTYDGELDEPEILPSQFPNILANGSSGIAVGMATSIPPHNINELIDALLHLIKFPNASDTTISNFVKGPDFPTGGILVEPKSSIENSYKNGKGSFRLRARWNIENIKGGQWKIIICEIPYQVQKSRLLEKISELMDNKSLPMLSDIRDESSENIRIVIEPKSRNLLPEMIMEAAEVVKQGHAKGKWKEKPTSKDIIYLHGPIIYEANMYHLAEEETPIPPFKKEFCDQILTHAPDFILDQFKKHKNDIEKDSRYFLPMYCEITNQIKKLTIPTYGVVERSGSLSSPGPLTKAMLGELYHMEERRGWISSRNLKDSWDVKVAGDKSNAKDIEDEFKKRPLSDSVLFDLILDEGEYIKPLQVIKQWIDKWPRSHMTLLNLMPEPFSTFLKISELKRPIKVETLNVLDSYDEDMNFTYHSAKLLPEYCFPLGLDIIDKLTKVPSWMRNSMRNEYHRQVIRKTMETGNEEYIKLALKSLIPNRNGWNRP